MIKNCAECGKLFEARTKRARFCKGPHIQTCAVCGKQFEYTCTPLDKPSTCSSECKKLYRKQKLLETYGVENVSQIPEVRDKKRISNASEASQAKMRQTCLERYGVERAIQSEAVRQKLSNSLKSSTTREKVKTTFQKHYGVDHIFMLPEYREKYGCNIVSTLQSTKDTVKRKVFEKYGVDNVSAIPEASEKAKVRRESTVLQRYGENCIFKTAAFKQHLQQVFGVDNISHSREHLRKAMRNRQNKSNLEIRLHNFLSVYNIEFIDEYVISNENFTHSFDVYLPKYNILIDCDGEYWHSYLSDPDGDRVREDGDPIRLSLVPDNCIFYLIVESDFERGLRGLQKILKLLDENLYDYDSELFKWCRSIEFPYYDYSNDRLYTEWSRLCTVDIVKYNPNCKFGISLVNQFHRSIYDAHCKDSVSPKTAWHDDVLLKKVIQNRLIYQNTVNPSKILQGFNISKLAPKVSVFNPVLARYLCEKYLQDFDIVNDPFSGFSGRLLGCVAAGKHYIGSDINLTHVAESNDIIEFLNLENAAVKKLDILDLDTIDAECVLTCPPYGSKEIYGNESEFKSCDEWIDVILKTIHARRYVFVVDKSENWKANIVEELKCDSYMRKSSEYVIVIDT